MKVSNSLYKLAVIKIIKHEIITFTESNIKYLRIIVIE